LPFDAAAIPRGGRLLLDSSVHIDAMRRRVPAPVQELILTRRLAHSAVVASELAWALGYLDSAHPDTAHNKASIEGILARMAAGGVAVPDPQNWLDAALAAATLSRRQTYDRDHRRKVMNDALIFFQSRTLGTVLISRNIKDFDLLDQLVPGSTILFYE
jgi:predicted nucleic acid-binding protein